MWMVRPLCRPPTTSETSVGGITALPPWPLPTPPSPILRSNDGCTIVPPTAPAAAASSAEEVATIFGWAACRAVYSPSLKKKGRRVRAPCSCCGAAAVASTSHPRPLRQSGASHRPRSGCRGMDHDCKSGSRKKKSRRGGKTSAPVDMPPPPTASRLSCKSPAARTVHPS